MNRQEIKKWLLENCFGKSGNKIKPNTGREQYWQKNDIRRNVYKTISNERGFYPVFLRIHLYLSDMIEYNCIKCGKRLKENRLFCNSTCQMTHFTAIPFINAQSPEVKARRNKTCIEKYGVDNPLKSTIIQEKIKNVLVEKYGVDNPMKCEKIKNIVKDKVFEKYGVDNVGKSPVIQEKIINTRKQNYLKRISKFGFGSIERHGACFALYHYLVKQYTAKQDLSCLENFDKPRTLCGVEGGYQLDHIISVKYGFENGILPSVIGDISNLQMLPWKENRTKGWKFQLATPTGVEFSEVVGVFGDF